MYVCIYIHNKYTQNTYYANKNIYSLKYIRLFLYNIEN